MINLLPSEGKIRILLERKKNIVVVLWFLVLFFILCLSLILFSINIYLQGDLSSQKEILQQAEEKFDQSETKVFQEKINTVNLELTRIESIYSNKIYFVQILEKISKTLPQDLSLKNLSAVLCDKEKDCVKMAVSGLAATRESLFGFKGNLEKESSFKEVSFPASNWVKADNIDFSATFKIVGNHF